MRAGDVDRLGGVVVAWYVGSDYRPTRRAAEGCERVKRGQSSKGLQVLRNQISPCTMESLSYAHGPLHDGAIVAAMELKNSRKH